MTVHEIIPPCWPWTPLEVDTPGSYDRVDVEVDGLPIETYGVKTFNIKDLVEV